MRFLTLFSTLVMLLLSASSAHAQGFRGPTLGGAGGWASSGAAPQQSFQRGSNFSGTSSHRSGVTFQQHRMSAPSMRAPEGPFRSSPELGPRHGDHGRRASDKKFHRHHRPKPFPRHPSLIIIDVPHVVGTTVITEVVPGAVSGEPSSTEDAPSPIPGRGPGRIAPFDPTPQEIVDRLLVLANVKKNDVLYDLGSGDGRILVAAAKKYGVRAVGFEIDPGLAKLARENVRRAGVENLVEVREEDFLTADLSEASVVTLYLSYDGNLAVRPQLMRQLRPGARVVSYTFDMGEWQPKIAESYRDAAGDSHRLYLWQIGETMKFSDHSPMLQLHPTRSRPLIVEVR